jgi:P-type conjugative transfer protein TrbJ
MKFLAAKAALVVALSAGSITPWRRPAFPSSTAPTWSQNIMTAIESRWPRRSSKLSSTTQLQQYENQLQNTVAPAAYIWDQAQSTINGLMNAVDTLNYYKTQLGSVDCLPGQVPGRGLLPGLAVLLIGRVQPAERAAHE